MTVKMRKDCFVYIWRDKKRKMLYIGCHFGDEQDGYICSSDHMRNAYKRRPQDFRRRILMRLKNVTYTELLEAEYKWLQLISEEELYKKYYNHSTKHFGHWMAGNNASNIAEKSGYCRRGRPLIFKDPQLRAKRISEAKKRSFETRRQTFGYAMSPEAREHNRQAQLGKTLSEEHKLNISKGVMGNPKETRQKGAMARVGKRYKIYNCEMCGQEANSGKRFCKEHAKIHHYQAIARRKAEKNILNIS